MEEPSTPKTLSFGRITSLPSPMLEADHAHPDSLPPLSLLDGASDNEELGDPAVERAQKEWECEAKDHASFLLALHCDEAVHLASRIGVIDKGSRRQEDKATQCRRYVPRQVIKYFLDHDKLTKEHEHTVTAAVMFADVSGFTRLTEQLTQHANHHPELKSTPSAQSLASHASSSIRQSGSPDNDEEEQHHDLEESHSQSVERGAEQLVHHLNVYFEQIIDVMHLWGGDIIKFAGDAMLCLFPSDGDLPQAVHRAALCARDLHNIDPSKRRVNAVQLSLHIGIGAGDVRFVFVGGKHERWEYLICDQGAEGPVLQMGLAEGGALPEETVVSRPAFDLLVGAKGKPVVKSGKLHGFKVTKYPRARDDEIPGRGSSLHTDAEAELRDVLRTKLDVLETFVPGAVRNRWDHGDDKWMCDLRRVTVLFINLKGLSVTDPHFLDKLQSAMHLIQTCLYREEGSVNKFLCDDKGMTLIAAFGLPPLSHRDDPLRAVRAATQITQRMLEGQSQADSQFGVRDIVMPSIGITTGRCFCGIVGTRRREYTMMGDTVNLAARLMQFAKNEVIVDRETYQASVHEINYDVRPPITVKGKEELVSIFTPNPEHNRLAHSLVLDSNRTPYISHTPFVQDFLSLLATYVANAKRWQASAAPAPPKNVGCVVQVTGEVGIGKSRLVQQFVNKAYLDVPDLVETVMGKGVQTDTKPLGAWTPIVVCLVLLWHDLEMSGKTPQGLRRSSLMRSHSEKLVDERAANSSVAQEPCESVRKNHVRFSRVRGRANPLLSNGLRVQAEASLRRLLAGTPHRPHLAACLSLLEIGNRDAPAAQCSVCADAVGVGKGWRHATGLEGRDVCGRCWGEREDADKAGFVEIAHESDLGDDLHHYLAPSAHSQGRMRSVSKEEELDPAECQHANALIRFLIARVAHRIPLMLVFEDAHYLDTASWTLLADLCKDEGLPCMVCIVFNHERVPLERMAAVTAHQRALTSLPPHRFHAFPLCGMDWAHTKRFAMARWNVNLIPTSQVLDMLIAGSEGNPLFCEGLMDELLDRNIVRVVGEGANSQLVLVNAERLSMVRIEQDLVAMLRARLDHLHANLQRTIKTAACVASFNGLSAHPCFTTHLLLIADSSWATLKGMNCKRDKLESTLLSLERDHCIFERVGEENGDLAYCFRSRLFRDVVYRSIPFTERRSIHLGLGMMLQWQRSSNKILRPLSSRHQVMLLEMISQHYSNSSCPEPAFTYGLELGMRLLDLSKDRKAATVLHRAMLCYHEVRAQHEQRGVEGDASDDGWQYLGAVCAYFLGVAKMRQGLTADTRAAMEKALRILDIRLPSTKFGIASAIASERVKKKIRKKASSLPSDKPVVQSKSSVPDSSGGKRSVVMQTFQSSNREEGRSDVLVDGRELEGAVSDTKFNTLLATIYTSLGIVYYESNERQLGDLSSAMAIAKAQQSRCDESGLVSQSYAHACITCQLSGQVQRAKSYKDKAELHLKQLRNFPAHNRIKADVLLSIATHDAGIGQWNSAIAHLSHAIMLAKLVPDDRLWERCAVQLANIHCMHGNTLHALTMLVAVYHNCFQGQAVDGSISSVELSAVNGMGWCLVTLGSVFLAKELMKSALGAALLSHSTDADDNMPMSLCLWLCQQPTRALSNAYNTVMSLNASIRTIWHRYRLLVSVLDTLFLQWARMLARYHDLGDAKPNAAPDNPPGVLGLGRRGKNKRKQTVVMNTMVMEHDFIDDVMSVNSRDTIVERGPYLRKPLKKVLRMFSDLAKVYPVVSSIPDVYWCWYKLFNNEPIETALAEMWSKLKAHDSTPLPQREELLAIVLTLVANPNSPECPALTKRLGEMTSKGELTTVLHLHVFHEYQRDTSLHALPRSSSPAFAKLLWTLHDRVCQRLWKTAERTSSHGLAEPLQPKQHLLSVEEFERMREHNAESVAKKFAHDPRDARLLGPELVCTLRLILQEQYYKKARQRHWVAENMDVEILADM